MGLASATTWTSLQLDVSDAVAAGFRRPAFHFDTLPDADRNLLDGGSWYIDDVQVWMFDPQTGADWTDASTWSRFYPGPAAKLSLEGGGAGGGIVFHDCINQPAMPLIGRTLDANDNQTYDSNLSFQFAWTGSATLASVDRGTLVLYSGRQAEVTFDSGEAVIRLDDPVPETIHVDLRNIHGYGTPVMADVGIDTSVSASYCHSDGMGDFWSDAVPTGTITSAQALLACQNYYGVGQCTASSLDAYWTGAGGICYLTDPPQFAWRFQTGELDNLCPGYGLWSMSAGQVHCPIWIASCGCTVQATPGGPDAKDGVDYGWCSGSNWN
jgi:hypothetical protein